MMSTKDYCLPMPSLEYSEIEDKGRDENPTKYFAFQSLFGIDQILNSPILDNLKELVLYWFRPKEDGIWSKVFKRCHSLESLAILANSFNCKKATLDNVTALLNALVLLPNLIDLNMAKPHNVRFRRLDIDSGFSFPSTLTIIGRAPDWRHKLLQVIGSTFKTTQKTTVSSSRPRLDKNHSTHKID
ncbi:hypothetical protein DFA_01834 [Cavenderia fasciculata]|uniref:Uncharacterized protein n=1 Tax=Cavenderia fasciculata TaxID=261658 RepID=F4PUY6_CACFS|nr:uncharacterized protein DFA_01834 [Cavenderia fasciculata]EGG21948.1 hypothetical protein DFA_01834 [Cavenderia fasciculata]|eukprot:XP_004359799.1 hypothetical protein DFA_01834 [Cavenderia fasciculata]